MSNLEHLIENGLCTMEHYDNPKDWYERMRTDINWTGNEHISMDELWTICQYVIYTYMPIQIDEVLEDYGL